MKKVLIASAAALVALLCIAASVFAWEPRIDGKPRSLEAGSTAGYYFWHDDGLHLWTTDPEHVEARYTGVIITDGRYLNPSLEKPENDDHFDIANPDECEITTASPSGPGPHYCVMTFSFHTFDGIDGVNFHIDGGSYVQLDLYRDGNPISVDNIFLGEDSVHPDNNPFIVYR